MVADSDIPILSNINIEGGPKKSLVINYMQRYKTLPMAHTMG